MLLRDPNFFEAVFASAAGMDVVNSLLLKRVYLRIMDYVREVLCEDWSEIPLPDFSKAVMGDVEELNRFLSLIILVSTSKAALRMEFEGLLGDIQGDGDYISNELKRIRLFRRKLEQRSHNNMQAESSKTSTSHLQAVSPPPDYQAEYCSLQLLYDAVSQEADALRAQLMQSEREKVAAHQDLDRLRAELCDLRQELAVLQEDREHAMAQCNDLALSNTKALIELASYRSSINCVLDQVKSLVGPFTELSEIPTQISKMIQKQSELQSALAALEKELSHAKQTISDLQTANNSLQLLLEEAGNRMVSTITEEQRRYDVLRLEHQELTQSHMRIQSLNDGLILEREGAKMEAQKAFDERDSVLKRVQQLEAVIGSFEHLKNEALLAQRLEHQTSEQMLNSQVLYWQKLYQGAVSSLEAAEVGLQEKLAELKCLTNRLDIEVAQRSQIIKRNEALVSKITSMKDQLRELRSSLKTRQLENQELVSRNAADTKMLGQLKAAIGELETEKASLRDEISRSEAQAYTLESALHSTREEHTLERLKLETELQKFHNELTRLRELATSYKEEIGLLQAGIKEERERSFLNQQQQAEYDRLVAQNSTLEHEVKGLLEELTSERQQFKELRETLKVTLSDLKTTQERLIDREDHGSRLERELKNEQYVRSCLEQSSCQAKILKYEQCQKWIDRLKGLLSEANQIREGISGMAAVGSNFVPAINHEGIAALQAVLKRRQGCDLEVETDPEYTSEVKLIESRIGQERKAMNEEHESVLTYIHQLGCQLYQRSFFTLG